MILSVIVPIYNGEKYMDTLVETLKNQQFADMEAVLVDDGSTDGTWELCCHYAGQYPWITAIHTENQGVSHARNTGLQAAKGQWIQFLDADDLLESGMLRHFFETVAKYEAELVICGCRRIQNGAEPVLCGPDENLIYKGKELRQLFDGIKMEERYWLLDYAWNKWYKKSVIDAYNLRFPEDMSLSEDFIFNTRYMQHISSIALVKECYYQYQVGEQGLVSRFQPKPWIGRMRVYEGHKALYQHLGLWKRNKDEILSQTGQIAFGDLRMINSPKCSLLKREKIEFIHSMIESPLFVMILTYLRRRKSPLFQVYYRMLRTRNKGLIYRVIQMEKMIR